MDKKKPYNIFIHFNQITNKPEKISMLLKRTLFSSFIGFIISTLIVGFSGAPIYIIPFIYIPMAFILFIKSYEIVKHQEVKS